MMTGLEDLPRAPASPSRRPTRQLVRAGFRPPLYAEDDLTAVGKASDGAAATTEAGIEATRAIVAILPATRVVIILTTYDLDEYVVDALRAGASVVGAR
jgi:hypothetical protein